VGVLAAGRPPLGGAGEELTGFFDGGEQHHRLLEIVREVVAVVQALIALCPNPCCFLAAPFTMGLMAYLPEGSQGTLGWHYVGIVVVFAVLLRATVPSRR
jgi:hypothetical protein